MSENTDPQPSSVASRSARSADPKDIRERVKRLHEKARSVSETLDRVERTLEEASGESAS